MLRGRRRARRAGVGACLFTLRRPHAPTCSLLAQARAGRARSPAPRQQHESSYSPHSVTQSLGTATNGRVQLVREEGTRRVQLVREGGGGGGAHGARVSGSGLARPLVSPPLPAERGGKHRRLAAPGTRSCRRRSMP